MRVGNTSWLADERNARLQSLLILRGTHGPEMPRASARAAPTCVSDNGLSKLWFRKLLKFPACRLIYRAKPSRHRVPLSDVITLQYLIAACSHSESRL